MKLKRPLLVVGIVALTLILSNLTKVAVTSNEFSENYPPVVCPATPSGESSAVSIPSTQTGSRFFGKKIKYL